MPWPLESLASVCSTLESCQPASRRTQHPPQTPWCHKGRPAIVRNCALSTANKHTCIRMAMYTSTSGSGSLVLFLLSCTSSLYCDTTLCIASPSMPMYSMKVRAVALLGEYVRMMTEHSTRSVSLLRSDDIERRARRVKRVSNWATARSKRTKLPRMSTVAGSARWYKYLHDAISVAII